MRCAFFRFDLSARVEQHFGVVLASCWCAGLLLGILAADVAGEILLSKMRSAVDQPVSIVPFLAAAYLPFLLSFAAILLRRIWIVLPISVMKAFTYGFCAYGLTLAFGQGGWLARFLFLFSDCVSLPILYLYWLLSARSERTMQYILSGICAAALMVVGLVDFCWIAPFWTNLI